MQYYSRIDKRFKTLSDMPTMLLTLIICLSCWTAGYVYSTGFPVTENNSVLPLWGILCDFFSNKTIAYVLGLFLFVIPAYVMQRMSDIEMLIRERTRLPFMFFMLLVSTNAGLLPFSEVNIVLICLVFTIYELFNSYQLPEATGKMFNAGVYLGIAGLFIPQILWFIPFLWVGMYQFRSIDVKSFLASLAGVTMIYWLLLAWCTFKQDFSFFISLFLSVADFKIFSVSALFQYYYIGFAVVLLLFILAFFHIKMSGLNNSVRVRRMLYFLLNMSVWALIMILLYGDNIDSFLSVLYLPVSVLATYFIENIRYRFRFILYYSILILCCLTFIIRVWNIL